MEAHHEKHATFVPVGVEVKPRARFRAKPEVVPATVPTIRIEGIEDDAEGLLVSFVDAAGAEHARAREDSPRWTYAGGRHEREFGPLPPGTYRASMLLPDGRRAEEDVPLAGEAERTIVLRPTR